MSVVVPVRNESAAIEATLEALLNQTHAAEEIIVVDGGSLDDTAARTRAMAREHARIRLIEAGAATPGRGRNVGLEAARTSWVALIDAVRAEPDWLEQLLAAARASPGARVVYGTFEPITDTFFTRCAALTYVTPRRPSSGGTRGPATMSMLIEREAWRSVGGFPDLRAAEDLLFFDRLDQAGVRPAWAPAARVHWAVQPSVRTTFRRFDLFSFHNVRAGLARRWHYGVARIYLVLAAFAALAVAVDPRWWLALPAVLAGRAAKAIWQRRREARLPWSPATIAGVMAIILILDAATFTGWLRAIRGGPASSRER